MHHQDTPPPFKLPYTTLGYTPEFGRLRYYDEIARALPASVGSTDASAGIGYACGVGENRFAI
jgi:hypothetical protein